MKEIVVASKNKGKINEIRKLFQDFGVEILSLADFGDIPEAPETGDTFLANACQKARYYARRTGKVALADDSGLVVDALGGEPGVHSARYAKEGASDGENNAKLLNKLAALPPEEKGNRAARFCCAIALADADKILATAEGAVEGFIIDESRGQGGFGYDPFFLLPAYNKTLSEISLDEKNKISHRGLALKKLLAKLPDIIS